ncbi:MAG: LPO_1073/Vpar_1526 family protein [Candidatus Paceibacterota bacterium]|jgi:hypothetical protein
MENSWLKLKIDSIKAYFLNKNNSPTLKYIDKSKKIDKSQHIHHGLSVCDAKEIVEMILDKKMIEFKIDAQTAVDERIKYFKERLFTDMNNLTEPELNRLKEPDAQYALREAAFISSKKTNKELINTLGKLVIGRIKNHQIETEDLKNIVFSEAIKTIDKLTPNELKIITLCYILSNTFRKGIKTIEQFNEYLNNSIKPFINFKNTDAEFKHIDYAGCGSISMGSWSITNSFRESYSLIFQKPFTEEEISKIILDQHLKTKIFVKKLETDGYIIPVTEKKVLKDFLEKEGLEEKKVTEVVNALDQHLMQETDIEKLLREKTEIGDELLKIINDTPINRLFLTSVGIAIAATYYENITGEKLNIDLWIN